MNTTPVSLAARAVPMVSVFTHKHGTSFGVVPAGEDAYDYWARSDDHDPRDGDASVDTAPLEQPYASAPDLIAALRLVATQSVGADWTHQQAFDFMRETARAALAKIPA